MNTVLQAKALNLNLGIKDMFILDVLKSTYIFSSQMSSTEITKQNPLINTKDLKESLEKLEDAGLIVLVDEWDRGKFTIEFNKENLQGLYELEDVEIKKERAKKKEVKIEVSKDEREVFTYYSTLSSLPDYKKMTDKGLEQIKNILSKYNLEEVKDALKYANEQHWLINKTGERWLNFVWIMSRLEDFMVGGKYRKNIENKVEDIIPKSKLNVIL